MDLFGSEACAVCDGRVGLEMRHASLVGMLVNRQITLKLYKNVRLIEFEVLDDVDELTELVM